MTESVTRLGSGLLYVGALILALFNPYAITALLFVFGLICLFEFLKLISLKSFIPYIIFIVMFIIFTFWERLFGTLSSLNEAIQILQVITIFMQLFLIKDLFSDKIPLFVTKRFLLTTFYISAPFIFLILITGNEHTFNPKIILGSFVLVWVNDSFAYIIGKSLGKQKLFEKISPKKTVEGFLGGLFFACIASFFISKYLLTLNFNQWLVITIIISVFGTLGDLIESKFKRQAQVKDSGTLMPGHGGMLDRLDSIIFAAPFIYLFLQFTGYVS